MHVSCLLVHLGLFDVDIVSTSTRPNFDMIVLFVFVQQYPDRSLVDIFVAKQLFQRRIAALLSLLLRSIRRIGSFQDHNPFQGKEKTQNENLSRSLRIKTSLFTPHDQKRLCVSTTHDISRPISPRINGVLSNATATKEPKIWWLYLPTKHTALLHTQVGFTAKSRLAEENSRESSSQRMLW